TVNDVFSYTVKDPDGLVSNTTTLTITVTGTDDAPVAHADVGAVNEDATLTKTALTGVIQGAPGTDTDVDNATTSLVVSGAVAGVGAVTQGAGVATSLAGTYGHLTLNADGSYSYIADTANALATGVTVNDVFSYTVKEPDGLVSNTTSLVVSGAVAGVGAVTQCAGVPPSLAGTYGHLTLNADGSYSYIADTADA